MTKLQRITNITLGIFIMVLCIIMISDPVRGAMLTVFCLSITLVVTGIKYLGTYFFMARHMVGGKALLYMGLIILDLGMFTIAIADSSYFYIMLYLFGSNALVGVIHILRSREAKRMESPSWKVNLSIGAVNILMAVLCIIFIDSTAILVYIYCAGLFYSAVVRVISALRRTEIAYIP